MFLLPFVCTSSSSHANSDTDVSHYQQLAQEILANAESTRAIVHEVYTSQLQSRVELIHTNAFFNDEVKEVKRMLAKGDTLFTICQKKFKSGVYDKQLVNDLDQAWRYYIKAGSAGARAVIIDKEPFH